jgi:hypothetical protein
MLILTRTAEAVGTITLNQPSATPSVEPWSKT